MVLIAGLAFCAVLGGILIYYRRRLSWGILVGYGMVCVGYTFLFGLSMTDHTRQLPILNWTAGAVVMAGLALVLWRFRQERTS